MENAAGQFIAQGQKVLVVLYRSSVRQNGGSKQQGGLESVKGGGLLFYFAPMKTRHVIA